MRYWLFILVACSSHREQKPSPSASPAPRTWKSFKANDTLILPNGRVVFRDLDNDTIDTMVDATPELLALVDRIAEVGPSQTFGGYSIEEGGDGTGPPDLDAERRLHALLEDLAKKPHRLVPCPDIHKGTFGARVVDAKRVFHFDGDDAWTKPFGPHSRSDHPDVAPVRRVHVSSESAEALRAALLPVVDGPTGATNVEIWTTTNDRCGRKLTAPDVDRVVDRILAE